MSLNKTLKSSIRDINDLKLQLTSSIAQSMAETSFSEEDVEPDSFMETADTIAGIPQKMLEAGIEVPTTLATGLGGMIVGGVETVGRGVLGAIDSDFYPQEDGYEGFQDWIEKRTAQFTHKKRKRDE